MRHNPIYILCAIILVVSIIFTAVILYQRKPLKAGAQKHNLYSQRHIDWLRANRMYERCMEAPPYWQQRIIKHIDRELALDSNYRQRQRQTVQHH